MFQSAISFNVDLSKWDVVSVTNMDYMFFHAVSFNRNLCGAAWIHSRASRTGMFTGSSGSISETLCMSVPMLTTKAIIPQYVSRQPISERELVVRTPTSTSTTARMITCPKCGTFEKSGRFSCCAPGGAWFKKCGGVGNRKVDHRWSQGVQACKRKYVQSVQPQKQMSTACSVRFFDQQTLIHVCQDSRRHA